MPSRDPAQRFLDIIENIRRIEAYTANLNAATFLQDGRTYDAVERCMERISEAAKKLGDVAELHCPEIAGRNCGR